MAFQKSAQSVRARLHGGAVGKPVVVGVTAVAAAVLVAVCCMVAVPSGGFSIERAAASESQAAGQEAAAAPEAEKPSRDQAEAVDAGEVCVHVGGAVSVPGVYRLPDGSRVGDAVTAAGGLADGAAPDAVNLARPLADGEQVIVPTLDQVEQAASNPSAGEAAEAVASPSGKVDINAASAAELDALPGIGPATAEKIVADRQSNGPFASVEDLKRVSGIGDKKYAQLADLVCVR